MRQAFSLLVLSAALTACATTQELHRMRLRIDLGYGQRRYLAVLPRTDPATMPRPGKRRSVGALADGRCEVAVLAHETTESEQLALCGGQVTYDLQKVHEHLEWAGLVTFPQASHNNEKNDLVGSLRVRDRDVDGVSRRQIAGAMKMRLAAKAPEAGRLHELAVDLWIQPERLRGHIAGDFYDLTAQGDSYVGTALLGAQPSLITITGRSALWRMPVADQVALLPLLLTCLHGTRNRSEAPDRSVHFTSLAEEEEQQGAIIRRQAPSAPSTVAR